MKNYKTIISLMSGTSIDSIDACLFKLNTKDLSFEIIDSYSLDYPKEIKEKILELCNNKGNISDLCSMNFIIGELFAKAVNNLLEKVNYSPNQIDFISSHGQTIYHKPNEVELGGIKTKSTLQIGDISVISYKTKIMTIGDFRTKDIAANGQGAPLVPFFDKIYFSSKNNNNKCIQNIGGISNVTVISNKCNIFAFDNGVGNILIDYFVKKLFNKKYDENGIIASKGKINDKWLNELLSEPYYNLKPPKTTGREFFNNEYAEKIYLKAPENKYDIIATLTAMTAKGIIDSYNKFILDKTNIDEIILGGGGAYNKALIKYMQFYMPNVIIHTHEDYGIPNKLKEPIAFGYLGYFALEKKFNNVPECTGADCSVIMGKISY